MDFDNLVAQYLDREIVWGTPDKDPSPREQAIALVCDHVRAHATNAGLPLTIRSIAPLFSQGLDDQRLANTLGVYVGENDVLLGALGEARFKVMELTALAWLDFLRNLQGKAIETLVEDMRRKAEKEGMERPYEEGSTIESIISTIARQHGIQRYQNPDKEMIDNDNAQISELLISAALKQLDLSYDAL